MANEIDNRADKPPEKGASASEERVVLIGLLILFGVVGLFLLYVTLIGGGLAT